MADSTHLQSINKLIDIEVLPEELGFVQIPNSTFFSSLSTLLPIRNIPSELGFLQGKLEYVFEQLFFKDF